MSAAEAPRLQGKEITDIADRLPFAYYPSRNQLEVAVEVPFLQLVPAECLVPAPGAGDAKNGLRADYCKGDGFDNPVVSRVDPIVHFDWGGGSPDPQVPADKFCARWQGWVVPTVSGEYTFYTRTDFYGGGPGGVRLWVDGKLVNDKWDPPPPASYVPGNKIRLEEGKRYEIKMEYRKGNSGAIAELLWKIDSGEKVPGRVAVRVLRADDRKTVATGTVAVDADGRGQDIIDLPDLPDGAYEVEYQFGKVTGRPHGAPGRSLPAGILPFQRIHFPWENNQLGLGHKVYPPFTPITVKGSKVSVVDRTYTINAFGTFDSVVSKGRELLAGPIAVVCETAEGREKWTLGKVKGEKKYDDLAVFSCQASCGALSVDSAVEVEEDGCAKISMKLVPAARPREIRRMWVEIPVKDAEAPLFHYAAEEAIRLNFGGDTPRGRNIVWDVAKKGWWPSTWSAEKGPDDAILWDSTKTQTFLGGRKRPFVPYIWLGAEERGLAWFGETDRYYVADRKQPVQVLSRENGVVYLRIYLGQMPFVLDKERTVVFGLQASPTKPMEKGWRTRTFASGVGPVVCWGGIACSSKYPDQRDFTIVDKIQEARRTGKVDRAWFEERDKQRVNPNEKVHGSTQWLSSVLHFADFASRSGHGGSGTYFEEHSTHQGKPEWGVFQDEWGMLDFTRFQDPQMHWGVARESYRDFTLYYANEWMKRGVSLYFDNTYTKISRNRRFTDAYLPPEGTLPRWSPIQWSTEIFGPRRYYRRIWKLAKEWNMKGAPYPIDVTYHMTNTAILPFSTWCTAVLELEQENRNIPWPTDYVRAVILQRRAGNITCVLDYLTGQARNFVGPDNPPEMVLTSWGMSKVHDARGGYMEWDSKFKALAAIYDKALLDFGYGEDDVAHYNYWDEKPFAQVLDDHVKWLAMTRPGEQPRAMILLQSYRKEESKARVTVPGAVRCKEIHTGEELTADDKGAVEVILPANYGTRMYLIDIK